MCVCASVSMSMQFTGEMTAGRNIGGLEGVWQRVVMDMKTILQEQVESE